MIAQLHEINDPRTGVGVVGIETKPREHVSERCNARLVSLVDPTPHRRVAARPLADGEIEALIKLVLRNEAAKEIAHTFGDGGGGLRTLRFNRIGVPRLPFGQQRIKQVGAVFEVPVETRSRHVQPGAKRQNFDVFDPVMHQNIPREVEPIVARDFDVPDQRFLIGVIADQHGCGACAHRGTPLQLSGGAPPSAVRRSIKPRNAIKRSASTFGRTSAFRMSSQTAVARVVASMAPRSVHVPKLA